MLNNNGILHLNENDNPELCKDLINPDIQALKRRDAFLSEVEKYTFTYGPHGDMIVEIPDLHIKGIDDTDTPTSDRDAYFKGVANVGNLYLDYTFMDYESEPIVFTVKSEDSRNLFLCLCSDIRYTRKWILVPTTVLVLEDLVDQHIDLTNVFKTASTSFIINVGTDGLQEIKQIDDAKLDTLDLPESGTYLKCDIEDAKNYIWFKKMFSYIDEISSFFQPINEKIATDSQIVKTFSQPFNTKKNANQIDNQLLQSTHEYDIAFLKDSSKIKTECITSGLIMAA